MWKKAIKLYSCYPIYLGADHGRCVVMTELLEQILHLGVKNGSTPLTKRRIILFNYLILFFIGIGFTLGIVNLFLGFISYGLLCFLGFVLQAVCLALNKQGNIPLSKAYFITVGILVVTLIKFFM